MARIGTQLIVAYMQALILQNSRQLLSKQGIFNAMKAHHPKRVLRRHTYMLDVLTRAAYAAPNWLPPAEPRALLAQLALAHRRPGQLP